MSRNFELLQKIGREQILYQESEAEVIAEERPVVATEVPELSVEVPSEPATPVLSLNPKELEEVTKLVQRLFVLPGPDAPRVVVFTGTEPGNGCSWMSGRVAEVLASQVRGSVCLVDANLRDATQHVAFGVDNHHGLSDSLRVPEPVGQFLTSLSRPNLFLMSCGSAAENWSSLLSSDRMRFRLEELRNTFDYVLIDAAPMSQGSDAVVLGTTCDGVVLVLRANSSRRESAKRAVSELQAAKARVLGAVLNQRTFPIPDSIYHKL